MLQILLLDVILYFCNMLSGKKAAFYTLGCKLNFSETSTIGRQLEEIGFIKTSFNKPADIYVINTCSVTSNANKECRRIIRKAKKISPNAFVVVTGCYAQLKPEEISDIHGVNLVLGAREKFNLPSLLKNINDSNKKIHGCEINNLKYKSSFSLNDRTRSFLKVQDGCNYPCTYCTIPLARGKSRCDSIENIIKNAELIVSKGVKEIVITGVNIGDFKDKNNKNFSELICKLDRVKGIERYRISSIEPNLISDEIINTVKKSKKFMPHFHIPLQSGSDVILGKMKRRYQSKLYKNVVNKIAKQVPNVSIGADVIVGFPGETNCEFNKTLELIKDLPLSYLHVFPYSERENTIAAKMEDKVEKQVISDRTKQLIILSNKLQYNFYKKFVKTKQNVLFESKQKNGMLFGFTDNYIKVKIPFNKELIKTKQKVELIDIDLDGIMKVNIEN